MPFVYLATMKKIATLLILCSFLFSACKYFKKGSTDNDGDKSDTNSSKNKKISKRDYSINEQNAYNGMFLDSSAVENFIKKNHIQDSIARRIRSFYNTRNYQFAWFSQDGFTEQAFGFWSLQNYVGDTATKSKQLQGTMDDLMGNDSLVVKASDKSAINTELLLTANFIQFARDNFEKGYVKRKEMERFIPFKKEKPLYLSDSLLNKKHKDDKYFSDINSSYKLLSDQLKKYADIAKGGGWPQISAHAKKLKKGKPSADVPLLKKYLQITGDLPQQDTTNIFDDNLAAGIKSYQSRFGYTTNGELSTSLIKEMNVPALNRVKQILINMNRMRWMPQEPDGRLIVVNIPEFVLHVYDGKSKVFDINVVVGKDGHNTTIFSDKLTTIVFSPYWNVPRSIVQNEIEPAIEKDPNYLEKHNMESTGQSNGLPVVRQKPGGDNSLGKVKFLFPNSFNIYFHDTPAKELFNKSVRAFSHGCIRLAEPEKLADYLLKDNSKWSDEKINEAMNSGDEQSVALKNPVPVFITYYTAWVDENGKLNFRNDIYDHDSEIASKMFAN
ncbi:MAG: L,D-transpeptidase family protein [Bacteroidota bacterium]|nr:L,D-transpeptidase family protein [Bacteroidota bacterium]